MILSQSKVKMWEATNCKRLCQAELSGEVGRIPNEYMNRGLFFEQQCLGSSAHDNTPVTLPLLKDGRKSMVQIRLEQQAQRFQSLFNPDSPDYMGWQITDRQLNLVSGDRDGTLDFVCRRDGVVSVWDLKSCEDLTSMYGWGNPEKLDLIQQGWYRNLYRVNYSVDPELYLIIFDYSPAERCKIIKVTISEQTMAKYLLRFDAVENEIQELELLDEFPRIPNFQDCKRCQLKCEVRAMSPNVDYQVIEI